MAQARKILVVDDDAELRTALAEQLMLHEEFITMQAENGAQALAKSRTELPDLVIIDVGLPDLDGREVVKIMRKDGFKNPVIVLTGHTSDTDAVLGLDSGPQRPKVRNKSKLGLRWMPL